MRMTPTLYLHCAGIHTGFFARGENYVESQKAVYLHNMVKS